MQHIENHFRELEQSLGNLADKETFTLIYHLIDHVRRLQAENNKLAALNRHYLHHFYNGDITKMQADFHYLTE